MKSIYVAIVFFILISTQAFADSKGYISELSKEVRSLIDAGDIQSANLAFLKRFDMDRFGKICLVDHWDEFSAGERSRYIDLFRQNLFKKVEDKVFVGDGDKGFSILNKSVKREGDIYKTSNELRTSRGELDLKIFLVKSGTSFRIVDIEVGGALLSRNYRAQFNYLIRNYEKEGFFAKLEKRL